MLPRTCDADAALSHELSFWTFASLAGDTLAKPNIVETERASNRLKVFEDLADSR